jgi:type I restriction enzyme S subunit
MIKKLCPSGVEFKYLWQITVWDKRFSGIDKEKQDKTCSFKHISAKDLKGLFVSDKASQTNNVKLLATGKFEGYTTEKLAGENLNEGEIITIPSGGTANLKYYKGKFVDSGNNLAISKGETINLKFVWYYLLTQKTIIEKCFKGSAIMHPDMPDILQIEIPIPPLEIQKKIAETLDTLIEFQDKLIAEAEERRKQYGYYRGELLTFRTPPPPVSQTIKIFVQAA